MSTLAIPGLWCVLQVTLLCAAGVALSLSIMRRCPASSAVVMSAIAIAILVATLFVPIQIPNWALPRLQVAKTSVALSPSPNEKIDNTKAPANNLSATTINLYALLSRMRTVIREDTPTGQTPNLVLWGVTTIVALGFLVGSLKLCIAFFAVWKIRHGSVLIESGLVESELRALARTMKCRLSVTVATSVNVESAAVIGWLRPLIVLPTSWKTWPSDLLRAVLAHELAHSVRRDYLWRAVGTIAQAVHYYHPLAHWLLRRLEYSQELAADQLAAQTLGSREMYMKALSRLAIRQDDQLHREPILLPTSSSHLVRRIKMLRTKERTQNRGLNFVVRAVAVSMVVLLAVVTTALRGLAEPADELPTTSVGQAEKVQDSAVGIFRYPPIDPAIIGDNEDGIFVLRVGELLKRESIGPMLGAMNQMASVICQSTFSSPELPEVDLRWIDYVVGRPKVAIKEIDCDPPIKEKHQLTVGFGQGVVRFNKDISSWKDWVRRNVPGAEELRHGKTTYFRLPVIPALGPAGLCVVVRDRYTLVFTENANEHFWEQVEGTHSVPARWSDEWNALDGGLFSIFSTNKNFEISLDENSTPLTSSLIQVLGNIQQAGYSVDWDDQSNRMVLKCALHCANQDKAELVRAGIELAYPLRGVELQEQAEKLANDGHTNAARRLGPDVALLENIELHTSLNKNGTASVHLETSAVLPLSDLFQEFLPREVANREPAGKGATKQ